MEMGCTGYRLRSVLICILSPFAANRASSSVGYCSTVPMIAVRHIRLPVVSFLAREIPSDVLQIFVLHVSDSRADSLAHEPSSLEGYRLWYCLTLLMEARFPRCAL